MNDDVWKTDPEWFRPWFNSKAYHVLYGHRSEEEAHALVRRLSSQGVLGKPGRALDAGCGAGRHARALCHEGWETTAFDLSKESIRWAKQISPVGIEFKTMDLRDLGHEVQWSDSFDLVTNFFTSLGYFERMEDQNSVIKGFAKVLSQNGVLIVDYLNVPQVSKSLIEHEVIRRKNVEFIIHRRIHEGWIEKSIQFEWEGRREHHVERVQALGLSDFENLLSAHDLRILDVWGDYSLNAWSTESPRCLMAIKSTH